MSEQERKPEPKEPDSLPLLVLYGEGYITRKDGTVVPFTFQGEVK